MDPSNKTPLAARLDLIRHRFLEALRRGDQPAVDDFVAEDDSDRDLLRHELVAAEEEFQRTLAKTTPDLPETREFHRDGDQSTAMPGAGKLSVRCPNCAARLELECEQLLGDIRCTGCGARFALAQESPAQADEGSVRKVAHFQLLEPLGQGGFGKVWKAYDTELDRVVAVKIPRSAKLVYADAEQFLREARSAARLHHPNIVSVYEVGREDDTIFIVSELISGKSLAELLRRGRLSSSEAASLCAKLADALQHAHEAGVVHRDLKPGNILIDEQGEPHIVDFGLAKREAADVTMTLDGQIFGTPAYMPPEQARGQGHLADARSDVYSLGVVLFELLTGELPFRGNMQMLLAQILHDEPPSPRKLNSQIPRNLDRICLKALSKEPARRYATASQMAHDLGRFLRGEPVMARPVGWLPRFWLWCQRPQRIREAGLLMMFQAVEVTLWVFSALVPLAMGEVAQATPGRALSNMIGAFFTTLLPLFVIGVGTVQRRLWAIWAGAIGLLAILGLSIGMLLGLPYDFGGLYTARSNVLMVFCFHSVLSFCGWLLYLVALVSYYSNRNAVVWAREAVVRPGG